MVGIRLIYIPPLPPTDTCTNTHINTAKQCCYIVSRSKNTARGEPDGFVRRHYSDNIVLRRTDKRDGRESSGGVLTINPSVILVANTRALYIRENFSRGRTETGDAAECRAPNSRPAARLSVYNNITRARVRNVQTIRLD